jgi:hypothetical protein
MFAFSPLKILDRIRQKFIYGFCTKTCLVKLMKFHTDPIQTIFYMRLKSYLIDFLGVTNHIKPVSIAERTKVCTVYGRLNIEIADSIPARGMDVCLRVSVLCCPVFR